MGKLRVWIEREDQLIEALRGDKFQVRLARVGTARSLLGVGRGGEVTIRF